MSGNTAADRDAKRRARYRGNPERARFQRQPDSEQFIITTTNYPETTRSSQEMVQRLHHVSLADSGPIMTPVEAVTSAYASLINCVSPTLSPFPQPGKHYNIELLGSERLADNEELSDLFPPLDDAPPVETSGSESAELPTPPLDGDKPSARRRQQQQRQKPRKASNHAVADTKPGDAPARFTRSMARKIGGVQPPRRHFGEGVSESQILF
ncbi:hypothetical protein IWW37_005172 [Coemansia sp. RSA 2050]|nr:hypothetical protein IWW37_005172 [Coemansia sp. RSA 2050]